MRDSYGGYGEFNALSSKKEDMGNGGLGGGGGRAGGGVGGTDLEAARVVAERAAAAGNFVFKVFFKLV